MIPQVCNRIVTMKTFDVFSQRSKVFMYGNDYAIPHGIKYKHPISANSV